MGRAFGVILLGSTSALGEAQPNLAARADAAASPAAEDAASGLPSVPKLELSLPPLAPRVLQRAESPFGPAYWAVMQRLHVWRGAGDGELRLRIETTRLQWGGFTLSAGITSIPEQERECAPSCTGPEWSSSVILRYPVGDIGPLRAVGPEIEVGGKLGASRQGSPGLLKAGVSGAF